MLSRLELCVGLCIYMSYFFWISVGMGYRPVVGATALFFALPIWLVYVLILTATSLSRLAAFAAANATLLTLGMAGIFGTYSSSKVTATIAGRPLAIGGELTTAGVIL